MHNLLTARASLDRSLPKFVSRGSVAAAARGTSCRAGAEIPRGPQLFKGVGYRRKRGVQSGADGRGPSHDRKRDATCNDGVFDGGGALLGLQKTSQQMHRRPLPDALPPQPAADHGAAIEQRHTLPSGYEFWVCGLPRNWQTVLTVWQAS